MRKPPPLYHTHTVPVKYIHSKKPPTIGSFLKIKTKQQLVLQAHSQKPTRRPHPQYPLNGFLTYQSPL